MYSYNKDLTENSVTQNIKFILENPMVLHFTQERSRLTKFHDAQKYNEEYTEYIE